MTEKINPILIDISMPIITPRLIIRPPQTGDGVVVYDAKIESQPELARWMPWAKDGVGTVEETEIVTRQKAAEFILRQDMMLLAFEKETGRFIAATGLHRFDWAFRSFEIGYWVRSSEHNKGYATKESVDPNTLRRWMSWSNDHGMSMQGTIDYVRMAEESPRCVALLGVDKKTGAHVLSTGLDADDDNFDVASTGWWLSAGHEGKGLAFEGMKAVVDLCKEFKICCLLTSCHYQENERSQNLMIRLGFTHSGTRPKAHQSHLDGQFYDVLDYTLRIP